MVCLSYITFFLQFLLHFGESSPIASTPNDYLQQYGVADESFRFLHETKVIDIPLASARQPIHSTGNNGTVGQLP